MKMPKAMEINGIGFDYGNTLVMDPFEKVMRLKANDFIRIMGANGYEVAGRKFTAAWSDVNMRINYPFCSHFAQETPLIRAVLEKLHVKKTDRFRVSQQLLASYRGGLKYILERDEATVHVKEVLGELKRMGKKLVILSNERVNMLKSQLKWTGLEGFFDKVIISGKLGIEKPDIRIFKYMLRAFDLPSERILYVGDDPERDIRPAKALGLKAALLEHPKENGNAWRNYGFELGENEKPDFMLKDLAELLEKII